MDAEKLFEKNAKMRAALKQMKLEKQAKAEASDRKLRSYEKLTTKLVPVVGVGFALAVLAALLSKPVKTQ